MVRWLVLLTLIVLPVSASAQGKWALALPRRLQAGESLVVVVAVGELGRGQEILVSTSTGQTIGTISPFGIRSRQEAGSYVLPVPTSAVSNDVLSLELRIIGDGPPRAPTAQEVKSVELRITPAPPTRPHAHVGMGRIGSTF